MAEGGDEIAMQKDLDNEFKRNLEQLEKFLVSMKLRDKALATEWIEKLKKSNKNIEERKLRNRFIKHFVGSTTKDKSVFSSKPFKNLPQYFSNPLEEFKSLLPLTPEEILHPSEEVKQTYISELLTNVPEGAKFLRVQPVPRQGSFFILLIVPDDSKETGKK